MDDNRIHLTVAVVIERDGQFLMVRETDKTTGQQVYNQPAGHVEAGESLTNAALRETLEETGWRIHLTHVLSMSTYTAPSNGVTYYRVAFCADPIELLDNSIIDDDIDEVVWLSYDELWGLKEQLRSPLVLEAIEDFRSEQHYPLDLIREHR